MTNISFPEQAAVVATSTPALGGVDEQGDTTPQGETHRLGMRMLIPEWATMDWMALIIAAATFVAMFKFWAGMIRTLGACVLVGLIYRLFAS